MKKVQSPGMVHVPWKFADERGKHSVPCWVLPKSTHQLILGNPFLTATKTLTKFRSRIKHELVTLSKRLRLQLLGENSQRLCGYLEGTGTLALPDTGSDVMFISRPYARKLGLTIEEAPESLLEVEFPDGSTGWTSGVVRDAEWTVGNKSTRTDFYVLDSLCVDVILSNDYLFENDIFSECEEYLYDADVEYGLWKPYYLFENDLFSECEEYLYDADVEDGLWKLCNIRLIGKYGETLDQLEGEYHDDLNSPDAFSPENVQRELARRDKIRDEIEALPQDQQTAAKLDENERQRRWEALRQIQRHSQPPIATATGQVTAKSSRKVRWMRRIRLSSLRS
ncbi:hypothetical protein BDV19DRAFT_193252 [Aspergillus venezuelensis]